MSGGLTAQPAGHPLDGMVRRLRARELQLHAPPPPVVAGTSRSSRSENGSTRSVPARCREHEAAQLSLVPWGAMETLCLLA